jgi:hypothetical protein
MISNASKAWIAGAALTLAAGGAQASTQNAVYLLMDGSGSISGSEFTSQVDAYVDALNAVFAANPAYFGASAVGAGIFGADFIEFFPTQTIDDATDLSSLTTAIDGLDPGRAGVDTGATAIGDAVTAARTALLLFEASLGHDLTLLIDVTTDGANNTGSDPETAAAAAVTAGIDSVNCLGIGIGADCTWVGASGTDFGSVDFDNLATALTGKLEAEFDPEVPVPSVLALLGAGILGLGFSRRRLAKK